MYLNFEVLQWSSLRREKRTFAHSFLLSPFIILVCLKKEKKLCYRTANENHYEGAVRDSVSNRDEQSELGIQC
jgi:hypothetical protein